MMRGHGVPQEHYFARETHSSPQLIPVRTRLRGIETHLVSAHGVFSHRGLDRGTELLVAAMEVGAEDTVLDLGCGYGAVAVAAARLAVRGWVVASDVSKRAVELCRMNLAAQPSSRTLVLQADGYTAFRPGSFDVIVTNPPIRAGWRVVFPLIDGAPEMLRPGGTFFAVGRARQGIDTLVRRIEGAFGNCEVIRRGSGYKVVRARRG
ncbi:MAG TPA: methyltransferase [Armatimonadota bacterium]|nr:methyltransferase [Armatimonadota bacterium]